MKTIKRGLNYNHTCYFLEINNFGITDVKKVGKWYIFYKNGIKVARYNEEREVLQA